MQIVDLLHQVLSLPLPWSVIGVELIKEEETIEVHLRYEGQSLVCPVCAKDSPGYDQGRREWRHLDLCEYQTKMVCDLPRVKCKEHGVKVIEVPWALPGARFTVLFESRVIDWLKVAPISAVARNMGISWDQAARIQRDAVARGLARRGPVTATQLGVDETSFQKRHEYVSIVSDISDSTVLYVADGRGQKSIEPFFGGLSAEQLARIDVVAMDMHDPFINVAAVHLPDWENTICFDRFHVAQLFSRAVDQVRRAEHKELTAKGDDTLKRTKFHWLKGASGMSKRMKREFKVLRAKSLEVAKAWVIKEAATKLWQYKSRTWAKKAWLQLCVWADETGLEPLKRVARTIRLYWIGIVNAAVKGVSNAASESVNSRVQELKRRAHGFRNRDRFRAAILFHLGGLDLYPRPVAHTKP